MLPKIDGIGVDITSIARIEALSEKALQKLFTPAEIEYCSRYTKSGARFAGRFAAKEAIVKTFGTGFAEGISFHDLEILPDEKGAPQVTLSGNALKLFPKHKVLLSISHDAGLAIAMATVQEV